MILEGIVPRDRMASMALTWRMTRTKGTVHNLTTAGISATTRTKGTAHNLTTAGIQATTRTKGTVRIRAMPITQVSIPMATTAGIQATNRMKDTADTKDMPGIMRI